MLPNKKDPLMEEEQEETVDKEVPGLPEKKRPRGEGEDGARIPLRRWVMHGAVMFGREFCYAMETALVTPVLLQIGLPKQYYSLTWFLSPILGLLFTPVIGSASDRCTLRWGRRRPFILALCVGVLLGVALFLNGSLIGLSISDTPGSQPVGIVLTVVGVVVLDFCADASEGPIRAYLLDVADTEEQDMALNIHAFAAGLGGAVGYMLGGLDWTDTALGRAFKSQEQVLFLFAGIIFIISVTLHMLSIPEGPYNPSLQAEATADGDSSSQASLKPNSLDLIREEDAFAHEEDKAINVVDGDMDFLDVERVRSKSDSALAIPDAASIKLDPDLDPESHHFLPEVHYSPAKSQEELDDVFWSTNHVDEASSTPPFSPPVLHPPAAPHCEASPPAGGMAEWQPPNPPEPQFKDQMDGPQPPLLKTSPSTEDTMLNTRVQQGKAANGVKAIVSVSGHPRPARGRGSTKQGTRLFSSSTPSRSHPHTFYRQPSFTFSYYGRVGSQRQRLRKLAPGAPRALITSSRSLNDLCDIQRRAERRELQLSASSLSSEGSDLEGGAEGGTTVRLLWLSMLKMPSQLWRLCVCHLLTWFSIIAEAVFYTDFMGEVIYHGDPRAPANSTELQNYNKGVQMGCWGLVVYAATAAVCSALLQKYLDNFDLSIKVIYILGTLGFSIGTAVMAIFPNVYIAMVMISSMGVISMSISYCPYALLGQYHEIKEYIHHSPENSRRGFGIDCAILSCQVYISQILVASALGAVVDAVGSVRVIPMVASGGSFLGFLTACFLVIYPDLQASGSELPKVPAGPANTERTDPEPSPLRLKAKESFMKAEYHSVV